MKIMKTACAACTLTLFVFGCEPDRPDYRPKTNETIRIDRDPGVKVDVDVPDNKPDVKVDVDVEP